MKLAILFLFVVFSASESFAQLGGYRQPNRTRESCGGRFWPCGSTDSYTQPGSGQGSEISGPIFVPRATRRLINLERRSSPTWSAGFHYACKEQRMLLNDTRMIHEFSTVKRCEKALRELEAFGDFCSLEKLYTKQGTYAAQFETAQECVEALPWYY